MDNLLSFILPVRIDNNDRLNNLKVCIEYLSGTFKNSELILVEDAANSDCKTLCDNTSINYSFTPNAGIFSRAGVVNKGILLASRKYVVIYDIDVLIRQDQIFRSLKIMEKGFRHIMLPHNSIFVNVKGGLKEKLLGNPDPVIIKRYLITGVGRKNPEIDIYPIPSGAVIFRKDILIKIGGYNKKMKSYGWEDVEVLKRAARLGIYYFSLHNGNIVHIDHERGSDSKPNDYYMLNRKEFKLVISMKPDELIRYIQSDLFLDKERTITMDEYREIRANNRKRFMSVSFMANRFILKLQNLAFKP